MPIQTNSYQTNNRKIAINNLSKKYKDKLILENINLYVDENEIVSIIGPSGCGKSTIFNILSNLTTYDCGNIYVSGNFSYMYQNGPFVAL